MLKLLLDEHISPAVATGFRTRNKAISIAAMAELGDGRLCGLSDDELLAEAFRLKLTLVTYDLRTIPPLLKSWAEQGRPHAGVIFVDGKTIPPSNFGPLIRGLLRVAAYYSKSNWANRILFLTK